MRSEGNNLLPTPNSFVEQSVGILVDKKSRVVCQGITGQAGSFHARLMLEYGTKLVAGVSPGKGGTNFEGLSVFETVAEAVSETGASVSVIFVPAAHADDAIMEAADAGIPLIVCITEGIPVLNLIRAKEFARARGSRLIGPNSPGVITPGRCKVGIMPGYIHKPGPIGVISRSGTLTYEVVWQLTQAGLGQSTCVGIGGDRVVGTSFVELLEFFERDPKTLAVVMIGEIGGGEEERAGDFARDKMSKPVIAFVAGETAPPGKRMGHAGAIISGHGESAEEKARYLEECSVVVVHNPAKVGEMTKKVIEERGIRL